MTERTRHDFIVIRMVGDSPNFEVKLGEMFRICVQ
jgi:hypothetical protein